jgi:hypothetical protein
MEIFGTLLIIFSTGLFLILLLLKWLRVVNSLTPFAWYCLIAFLAGIGLIRAELNATKRREAEREAKREQLYQNKPRLTIDVGREYYYENVKLAKPPSVKFFDGCDPTDEGAPLNWSRNRKMIMTAKRLWYCYMTKKLAIFSRADFKV